MDEPRNAFWALRGQKTLALTQPSWNLAYKIAVSVWSGFGTGNDCREWDFAGARTFDLGMVFFVPVYNFRYQPGIVEHEHSESPEEDHEHPETSGHEEHGEAHEHHEHSHVKGAFA